MLDQLDSGISWLSWLFDNPATLAADPSAAHVEHLHRRLEFVVGECHHVGVGAVPEHHGLLFHGTLQCGQVVAKPRRSFEVQLLGRGVHLLFQGAGEPVGLAGQKVAEVCHDLAVLGRIDPANTRRGTFVDVAEQAWTIDLPVPLKHPRRASSRRKHPGEQIQRFPDCPRVRVRPEIAHTLAPRTAIDHQPGKFLAQGDRQHRVGLVVAVADVESRIELLDPGVFQLQCLNLGPHDRPFDLGRGGHQLPGPRR
ncbi:Uncharacterised protein [Mycobacterium tuberculosis]|nr:Uncharacterised protein [Mycobacterium tuberculosis]CKT46198.1 Uncharacterised protein [Mycobacterium tuberculosis]COV61449.1 Uncharacterised protein [Mycobacterium tuberculosis]SGO84287.1 Uncharacterised protein [Mycobacterium tuberculosis]